MSLNELSEMDDDEFFQLLRDSSMSCFACKHRGQAVTERKLDGHSFYYCSDLDYCLSMRRRNGRRRSQSDIQIYLERRGGYHLLLNVRCQLTSDGAVEIYSATGVRDSFNLDHLSDEEWFRLEQAIIKKAQETRGQADEGQDQDYEPW